MTGDDRLDPARWAEVNDIFHRALEVAPEQRARFVRETCVHADVKAEVASLLEAHASTHAFMEKPVDRDAIVLSADPLVGRRVGHYDIERVLGAGGMGVVYFARDTKLGRAVALKSLPAHLTDDPRRRERLKREAQLAASLAHPGIATVYALEEFDGHLFIASEYLAGRTLRQELERGALSPTTVLGTAVAIARPLQAAHQQGLVHRDLKPENVMRTETGAIKLLDFGLARTLYASPSTAPTLTTEGTLLGTPAYMSPEQIRGAELDFRSDLFSFGVLVYELATGVNPFAGADAASTIARILETEPVRLEERLPPNATRVPILGLLVDVVGTCLRKDPALRFESTAALVAALERAETGAPVTIERPAVWWWQFHQGLACLFYCLLLVPLWYGGERITRPMGEGLFAIGLVSAIVTVTLRLHLWFTWRSYPTQWLPQRVRSRHWVRVADVGFVSALLAAGFSLLGTVRPLALVLIGAAVVLLLAVTVIEPTTERAAFEDESGR
jgi:serine/threonine protein kinase